MWYLLKVPRHASLDKLPRRWETAVRDEAGDRELRTASGELWETAASVGQEAETNRTGGEGARLRIVAERCAPTF